MAQDTTKADAALQNHYLPVLREMINQRALLLFGYTPAELEAGMGHANAVNGETINYGGIIRDADKFEFAGRQWFFAAHVGRNESGTASSEGGYIPLAGEQKYEDFFDTIVHFYKQIEITGYAMEISDRSIGRYLSLLEGETEGAINDARYSLNREGYGDGTGLLTSITAEGSSTFTATTLQYLRVGMYVDVCTKADGTVVAARRKLTAINPTTKVCTYSGGDAATTTAEGIYLPGGYGKEINGLTNIVDNAATFATLHGVDGSAAGNEYWKAKMLDGASGTFDEDQGQQMLDLIATEGYETEIIITTRGVRRRYVNTLKAQKRWNDGMAGTLHGGFKTIDFNGVPLTIDDQCPKGKMWFLRPSDFAWFWLGGNDFRWLQRDGKILRMVTGAGAAGEDMDSWRATIYRFHDLAITRRKTQGVIYGLADDAAVMLS